MKKIRASLGYVCCTCLTIVVAINCTSIEYLNYRAGGYLPRKDFGPANRKWRIASEKGIRIDIERRFRLHRLDNIDSKHDDISKQKEIYERQFSAEELVAIEACLKSKMKYRLSMLNLHQWVSTMGLLQYVLAPLALFWALIHVFMKSVIGLRLGALFLATVNATSIVFLLYRGYYQSLGW